MSMWVCVFGQVKGFSFFFFNCHLHCTYAPSWTEGWMPASTKQQVLCVSPFQRGNNPNSCETFVRAELDGVLLGESARKQDVPVEGRVDYNFTCSFHCSDAAQALDDIAHKPVICKSHISLMCLKQCFGPRYDSHS